MRRAALIAVLVALRVVLILVGLSTIPADGRTALGNDARRFLEIARSPGVPYEDFQVEVPPISVAAIRGLATSAQNPRVLAARLVWAMLACELCAAALLAWAWGLDVATRYLVLGLPVAFFIYFRLDLLSVLLAVAGLALARRGRPGSGGFSLVAGAFTKIWPAFLLPALAVRRSWRGLAWAAATGVAGLLAWVLAFGTDGPRQVLTFRGATGWGVESTIGLPLWTFGHDRVRFESGAFRVGHAPVTARMLLLLATIAILTWVWYRATEATLDGAAPVAALAAVLLLSPQTSLQWIVWLFPWIAVSGDRRLRTWALFAGASATGVYLAATVGGNLGSTVGIGLEFLRVAAIFAMFFIACRELRMRAQVA
ncbi:MAG: DUF2029 domain-containing protein [Actinobacteria bacterium]|nr:DUF2029 domain-containing protein [Actinomycetota bacterium]